MKNLSDELRYNYSNLWLSILSSNVEGIREYSKALGVEELYGIFAAMITARSWEAISSKDGIARRKLTQDEVRKFITRVLVFSCLIPFITFREWKLRRKLVDTLSTFPKFWTVFQDP